MGFKEPWKQQSDRYRTAISVHAMQGYFRLHLHMHKVTPVGRYIAS